MIGCDTVVAQGQLFQSHTVCMSISSSLLLLLCPSHPISNFVPTSLADSLSSYATYSHTILGIV